MISVCARARLAIVSSGACFFFSASSCAAGGKRSRMFVACLHGEANERTYRRRIIRHFPPLKSVARGGNFTQKSDAFLPISVILVSLPSDMSDDVTPMLVHDSWNLYRGVSDLASSGGVSLTSRSKSIKQLTGRICLRIGQAPGGW
jgi:hypothetical protein